MYKFVRMHKKSGFFLLEILCAIACMGLMWIVLARSCVQSVMLMRKAQEKVAAAALAQNFLENCLSGKQEAASSGDSLSWSYNSSIPKMLNGACAQGEYHAVVSFKCIEITTRNGDQEVTFLGMAPPS